MSKEKAQEKRAAKARQSPAPQPQAAQPGPVTTVADLLQLMGAKDVEIMELQRKVAGLEQQVKTLVDQYVRKEEKKD